MYKKIFLSICTVLCLCVGVSAYAFDGRVYFGKYFDQTLRSAPAGGIAEYVAGVDIGQRIDRFRAYVGIETLMDTYNSDSTFHPASVAYNIGMTVRLFDSVYLRGEHQCWHPIDSDGDVEQYNLIQVEYRFGECGGRDD